MPDSSEQIRGRTFVYLAYLDDSDTKQKSQQWQVLVSVMVRDSVFDSLELISSVIAEDLIPAEMADQFEEFHACELYGGYGIFEGIEQTKRLTAIRNLLNAVKNVGCSVA